MYIIVLYALQFSGVQSGQGRQAVLEIWKSKAIALLSSQTVFYHSCLFRFILYMTVAQNGSSQLSLKAELTRLVIELLKLEWRSYATRAVLWACFCPFNNGWKLRGQHWTVCLHMYIVDKPLVRQETDGRLLC